MSSAITIAAVPLLLFAAMSAPLAHAREGHEHHAHAAASQEVPTKRHATDAPLRKGMAQIRTAVDALGHYERGHMGVQQVVTFATTIQEQIAYLVANCKLEPQADAALHGIIAKLGAGAQALKNDPADLAAIPPMREALADYRRSFDDPAFEPAADRA